MPLVPAVTSRHCHSMTESVKPHLKRTNKSIQFFFRYFIAEPFIITLLLSSYKLKNVERDVKYVSMKKIRKIFIGYPPHPDLCGPLLWKCRNGESLKFCAPILLTKCYIQTVKTHIRMLFKEQSDQGLYCYPFHQIFCKINA